MKRISGSNGLSKKELCKHEPGILFLYVHIPFCPFICRYCCWTIKYSPHEITSVSTYREPYVEALKREIEARSRLSYAFPNQTNFKVIHFGGGTPSQLQPTEIASILDTILVSYDASLKDIPTVGIEIRPGDFSLDDFRFLHDTGFNRISLGVQSFDPVVLARMGRKGSVEQMYRTYDWIRKAGFEDVNIDLLYGFPFQTFDQWKKDIKAAIALQPDHIDAHPWAFVDGRGWLDKVKADDQAEKAKKIRWTRYLRQRLTESGYSNYNHRLYCTQGKENLMHLVAATYSRPFLAFGAGAEHYRAGLLDEPRAHGASPVSGGCSIKGYIGMDFSTQRYTVPEHPKTFSVGSLINAMSRQLLLPEGIDLPFTNHLCCCDLASFLNDMRYGFALVLQEIQCAKVFPGKLHTYKWATFKRFLKWIDEGRLVIEKDYLRFREHVFPLERSTWFLYKEI